MMAKFQIKGGGRGPLIISWINLYRKVFKMKYGETGDARAGLASRDITKPIQQKS